MKKLAGMLQVSHVFQQRYRIERVIGQGGMSAVYLAEDLKLSGKRWAIKQSFHYDEQHHSDHAEMDMLVQLEHPHLPSIVDYYPPDVHGHSYVVMDYIQGHTLQQLFEKYKRRIPIARILKYALQLCDLLSYLHQFKPAPIIYRDLKPANIIVNEQDRLFLIDFGIARNYKLGQEKDTIPMGTIGFAAPEQFEDGQQSDHRTDLYNLGALLYYLLSGGRFYTVAHKPLSTYANHLPYGLEQAIEKLLQPDPADRYQDVQQVQLIFNELSVQRKVVPIHESQVLLPQYKTIVIGSLYARAGSTFAALALARVLNSYGIQHALLEHPSNTPQLYSLLYGDRFVPKDYVFLEDQLQRTPSVQSKAWHNGESVWLPLHPHKRTPSNSSKEYGFRLIYAAKSPITIIDISTNWTAQSVTALCLDADEIICVADGHPDRFSQETAQQHIAFAHKLKALNKSVHFIANRYMTSLTPKEGLDVFPWSPLCKLPNIAYEQIMQAVWKQRLVFDDSRILEQLRQGFEPFLKRILPPEMLKQEQRRRRRSIR